MILPTRDWNAGSVWQEKLPDEWKIFDSNGEVVYYTTARNRFLANFTRFCGKYDGKTYPEALAEFYKQNTNWNVWDGIATDGLWKRPWGISNIDFDRNGKNDFGEYGSDWVYDTWYEGLENIVKKVKEAVPPGKTMVVNAGGSWEYFKNILNGHVVEKWYTWGYGNWASWWGDYSSWTANGQKPSTYYVNGTGTFDGSKSKTNYRLMRFGLCSALLGDGYYSYEAETEHLYNDFYDEFDVPLGYPTSNAQKVATNVWARFFTNGVSIVNGNAESVTVTDAQLRALSGYRGPYYRFIGNQCPAVNNGTLFNQVTLEGGMSGGNYSRIIGDGIVLVNAPNMIVVTDIYLDNAELANLAGQDLPTFTDLWYLGWHPDQAVNPETDNPAWTTGPRWCSTAESALPYMRYRYADAGSGSKKAIYPVRINVSGSYEVFEWHGWIGSNWGGIKEATNTPYIITHANGTSAGTIDQSMRSGEWIPLGTYVFNAGGKYSIEINNKANGPVIADAFKLVCKNKYVDNVPPNAPGNLYSQALTEHSMSVNWTPSSEASDGDTAIFYMIYRDQVHMNSTTSAIFQDNGLSENTSYHYEVYAVDDAGNKSDFPSAASFTTLPDVIPPLLVSVELTNLTCLRLTFSEPMGVSAENIHNYTIESNVSVLSAKLLDDLQTVELNTSDHYMGATYTVTVSNVTDRAVVPNFIQSGSSRVYEGVAGPLIAAVTADDNYEIYLNGVYIGKGDTWKSAETFTVDSRGGKNVVAIKAYDKGGMGGVVAQVSLNNRTYVSNENWKVSKTLETGWETLQFNDIGWQKATSYGQLGKTEPWSLYSAVSGFTTTNPMYWIWSSDYENDNIVYFRLVLGIGDDITPPEPPTGLVVTEK